MLTPLAHRYLLVSPSLSPSYFPSSSPNSRAWILEATTTPTKLQAKLQRHAPSRGHVAHRYVKPLSWPTAPIARKDKCHARSPALGNAQPRGGSGKSTVWMCLNIHPKKMTNNLIQIQALPSTGGFPRVRETREVFCGWF